MNRNNSVAGNRDRSIFSRTPTHADVNVHMQVKK
jgi:hypothetical protein